MAQTGKTTGPLSATMAGKCPRCGTGPLYVGMIKLAPACTHCGLDFEPYEQGDGPAVFALFIVGFIVVGGALWWELASQPAYWLQAVVWIPVTAILSIICLRGFKSWLVAEQFRHDAHEGRFD